MARAKRNTTSKRSRESRRNAPQEKEVLSQFEAELEYQQNKIRFGKLQPRNKSQAELIQLLEKKRLVFILGPAGTGKTYLSTSFAAEALIEKRIDQIIITRPQVGCDEDMGFLPGDEGEKFASWIMPFMDILEGKLGKSKVASFMKFGQIQARPLGKMRGSTFRNSIVILDEAQNTTPAQMKMFLTRIGEGTQVIINGDIEQSDLPSHQKNGLEEAVEILRGSRSVGIHTFGEEHITRDALVREVVLAYRRKYQKLKQVA